jgi:uncharacterized protein YodC (DUF2158 family)
MKTYAVNTPLGITIIKAETPTKALVKHWVDKTPMIDTFQTREDLLKRGYKILETTKHTNLFLVVEKSKFNYGDKVIHRSGKRPMIVTDIADTQYGFVYDCKWEIKDDFGFGAFEEYELKKLKIKK